MSELDITSDEMTHVQEWLAKKYLTKKDDIYKFNSKYRAGTLGLVQKGSAYLHVIGENIRDLFIGEGDLGEAKEGDLIIAQRLLGVRGTPSAKIAQIVGREESYSIAYIIEKESITRGFKNAVSSGCRDDSRGALVTQCRRCF